MEGAGRQPLNGTENGEVERDAEDQPCTPHEGGRVNDTVLGVRFKQEPADDIKDYAETTMNELLGWYGYTDKVGQRDTAQLTLSSFHPSTSSPPSSSCTRTKLTEGVPKGCNDEKVHSEETPPVIGCLVRESVDCHNGLADDDLTASDNGDEERGGCNWCQRVGVKLLRMKTPSGNKSFCSETCFNQCRRANFKKSKVCDWCKHIRHTVNFVDLREGEIQLQFCGEKCLNQYKMNIFCTETQEHLKQIQTRLNEERKHVTRSPDREASASDVSTKTFLDSSAATARDNTADAQILITPELWLAKQTRDKSLKNNEAVEMVGQEKEDIGMQLNTDTKEQAERETEPKDVSVVFDSPTNGSGNLPLDKSILQSSPPSTAVVDPASVISCTNSLPLSNSGLSRTPETGGVQNRAAINKERQSPLVRTDSRKRSNAQSSECPSSLKISPTSLTSQVSYGPSSPSPILFPHLNDVGAELAGLAMYNRFLCSPLLGSMSGDGRFAMQRLQLPDRDRSRKDESGIKPKNTERTVYPYSSKIADRRNSQAHGTISSGTPPIPLPPHPLFRHPSVSANGPRLDGLAGFPPSLPLGPVVFGFPPFTTPPALFPPDPVLSVGNFLGMQSTPSGTPQPQLPPLPFAPPHRPPQQQQQQQQQEEEERRQQRQRADNKSLSSSPTDCPIAAGVPPVTVMMPFPVVLPIPVPIPFPIPIAPEKIHKFFEMQEKTADTKSSSSPLNSTAPASPTTSPPVPQPPLDSDHQDQEQDSSLSLRTSYPSLFSHQHRYPVNLHHPSQEQPKSLTGKHDTSLSESMDRFLSVASLQSLDPCTNEAIPSRFSHDGSPTSCSSASPSHDFQKPNRQSMKSALALLKTQESPQRVRALRRERSRSPIVAHNISASVLAPKRSLTHAFPSAPNFSKRTRLDNNQNNEEALDLSKGSHCSIPVIFSQDFSLKSVPRETFPNGSFSTRDHSSKDGGAVSGIDKEAEHNMAGIDRDSDSGSRVPKIHIIDTCNDPPLAQPLPLPPADHAYSIRRNLILDAPNVPKPARSSPSPERRYVRTVPREMVEAAKRRCMRARIRSK